MPRIMITDKEDDALYKLYEEHQSSRYVSEMSPKVTRDGRRIARSTIQRRIPRWDVRRTAMLQLARQNMDTDTAAEYAKRIQIVESLGAAALNHLAKLVKGNQLEASINETVSLIKLGPELRGVSKRLEIGFTGEDGKPIAPASVVVYLPDNKRENSG